MSVVLAAEHLTKTFVSQGRENYTAVDDVSFSVESGEKLGIIGESGSGKTTVVNMITRLLDVSSGTIRLDGEDITLKKGKELKEVYKKMQMVFQTPTESFDPRSVVIWYNIHIRFVERKRDEKASGRIYHGWKIRRN